MSKKYTPEALVKRRAYTVMYLRERCKDPAYKAQRSRAARTCFLKNKYGITVEQYEEMLTGQGSACAICRRVEPGGKGGFHIDHDHITGKIRGLLCHSCNVGLGHFTESEDLLQKALLYLKDNR